MRALTGCGCDTCQLPPYKGCIPVFTPEPVLYSQVVCRGCGGRTVEMAPKEQVICMDYRQGVGVPFTRITSFRFVCEDCEVMTWKRN